MDINYIKRTFQPSHTGDVPIYIQLANYLRIQIKSGNLAENDKIIPEEEISNGLGISRTTVRQAINILVEEGLLIRYRGKGTFVSEKKYPRSLNHLYNFTSDMKEIGVIPSSRTIKQEVINIKGTIYQDKMELSDKQTDVFHLIRVRNADDKPVLFEDTYIPYFLCPGIENNNFDQKSLYETLQTNYSLSPFTAIETLQGIIIPKSLLSYLNCENNTVGYRINRIARLDSNFVYEYTTSVTRADLCFYQFQLSSSSSKPNSSIILGEVENSSL